MKKKSGVGVTLTSFEMGDDSNQWFVGCDAYGYHIDVEIVFFANGDDVSFTEDLEVDVDNENGLDECAPMVVVWYYDSYGGEHEMSEYEYCDRVPCGIYTRDEFEQVLRAIAERVADSVDISDLAYITAKRAMKKRSAKNRAKKVSRVLWPREIYPYEKQYPDGFTDSVNGVNVGDIYYRWRGNEAGDYCCFYQVIDVDWENKTAVVQGLRRKRVNQDIGINIYHSTDAAWAIRDDFNGEPAMTLSGAKGEFGQGLYEVVNSEWFGEHARLYLPWDGTPVTEYSNYW